MRTMVSNKHQLSIIQTSHLTIAVSDYRVDQPEFLLGLCVQRYHRLRVWEGTLNRLCGGKKGRKHTERERERERERACVRKRKKMALKKRQNKGRSLKETLCA